ncbi:CPBP family intramembrane glutamic endopeptidase [Acidicapsa dinghuensis]|uniref:CPBP family intramembrane glutamic endopeptidase n=1 Tax=Acidicapsa dinghuensis TaxID=2218256 RepID=A0ABW1ELN0_9BACT|nr:CPBP family intramembrane glutamic endopeptidase [Acidicapsa dinghuensis]
MPDNEFFQEPGQPTQPPVIEPPELPAPDDTFLPETTAGVSEQPFPIETQKPRAIAPIWHTLILVVGILAFSIWGAVKKDSNPFVPSQHALSAHEQAAPHQHGVDSIRLIRYGLTGLIELAIVAWVIFGLRLRKVPFRSLFGAWPRGLNNITMEAIIAAAFWLTSMAILVVLALTWAFTEIQIDKYHRAHETHQTAPSPSTSQPGTSQKPALKQNEEKTPDEKQADLIRELTELAPANGVEIVGWGLLCLIVGFSEEVVFRGYLQTQSILVLRKLPVGLVFTAVIFGLAHGYQGVRGIVLISVYGLLFGIITRMRRNLFPGMLAHSWHDFFTGMMLALIRASGLLNHLPHAH